MSELAEREQRIKRGWALPGGSHDRVVKAMKLALPALIGVVGAFLVFSPLEEKQEVSFVLDKNKVDTAEERLKVSSAQYRGQDDLGRPFVLSARSALQATSAQPVVEIGGLSARMLLESGPAGFQADRARYNMDNDHVDVVGPILFTAADGYRMDTRDVTVNMRARTLVSRGPVQGSMPLGRFTAGQLRVNLPDRKVELSGRARLHIDQGAIR